MLLREEMVALLPVAAADLIGYRCLGIRFLHLLGVLVGGMRNASGLDRRS